MILCYQQLVCNDNKLSKVTIVTRIVVLGNGYQCYDNRQWLSREGYIDSIAYLKLVTEFLKCIHECLQHCIEVHDTERMIENYLIAAQ